MTEPAPERRIAELTREVERLTKINKALVGRVERGMDWQGDAFSLFQAATVLDVEVQRRTAALNATLRELKRSNDALKGAKDAADSANRAKSEFLANMSHEIRTPMNGVLGMAELLASTEMSAAQRRWVGAIQRSGQALLGIINAILDFSKIEAGHLELEEVDFDLRETVEDTVELVAESARRKGLDLVCWVHPAVAPTFRGDPHRLRQVLTNLVGNAVKFTHRGEVVVRVGEPQGEPGAGGLSFSISDTGIGLSPAEQGRIFESFRQADGSTTREYGGTGLGLAITRQLVEAMGGVVTVRSERGRGSTFSFSLPMVGRGEAPAPPSGTHLHDRRVLIVGRHAATRGMIADYSRHWGMVSMQAESAEGAVESSLSSPPDLVICDQELVTEDLVRWASATGAPVLRLGHSVGPAHDDAPVEWVGRPVRPDRLLAGIVAVLGGSVPRSHAPPADRLPHDALPGSPMRILVAEDNAINREVVVAFLEDLGARVETAPHGEAALDLLSARTYDLVLMDCQMPRMDGPTATRAIRRREAADGLRRLPIVALTANAMSGDRQRCLDAGMDDFLAKPFTAHQLREVLAQWGPGGGTGWVPPEARRQEDIDWAFVERLATSGRPDLPGRVASLYREHTPAVLASMREAAQRADADEVRAGAHRIKSSSYSVGAGLVAELCAQLEAEAGPVEAARLVARVDAIDAAFSRAERALARISG